MWPEIRVGDLKKLNQKVLLAELFLIIAGVWAVTYFPQLDKQLFPLSNGPGPLTFLTVGLLFTLVTVIILYLFYRSNKLSLFFFISTVLYSALIIGVRFILSPLGVYEYNKVSSFSCNFGGLDTWLLSSGLVFILYFSVFLVFYLYYRRKSGELSGGNVEQGFFKRHSTMSLLLVVGLLVLMGAVVFFPIILLPFLFIVLLGGVMEYMLVVMSVSTGLFISLSLLGAILFLRAAYKDAANQAAIIKDAGILTGFFWIGASLLAIYSGLWVLYMLTIVSLWPLKTFCGK
ncbi:hypothetical protein HYY72_02815 [Candidatus Woesearchaeota archaeon]|nr:hypothetical protein [Candidatus Woesearchaeota archaeon]